MRLILEVAHLKNATPATVSRGGVLYINDSDVGWRPFFDSWLSKYKRSDDEYAENVFTLALSHYINDQFLRTCEERLILLQFAIWLRFQVSLASSTIFITSSTP